MESGRQDLLIKRAMKEWSFLFIWLGLVVSGVVWMDRTLVSIFDHVSLGNSLSTLLGWSNVVAHSFKSRLITRSTDRMSVLVCLLYFSRFDVWNSRLEYRDLARIWPRMFTRSLSSSMALLICTLLFNLTDSRTWARRPEVLTYRQTTLYESLVHRTWMEKFVIGFHWDPTLGVWRQALGPKSDNFVERHGLA